MPRSSAAAGNRHKDVETDEEEELVDLTVDLALHSRRSERQRKRQEKKASRSIPQPDVMLDLPYELMMGILSQLLPKDVISLSAVSRTLRDFIHQEQDTIADTIIRWRYHTLEKCIRLPVLLTDVDREIHADLQTVAGQEIMAIHKKPYQHVQLPDPTYICTCLTCILRWNSLCLIMDFAHWQDHLDGGEPIPIIARGQSPEWNQKLLDEHAAVVHKALTNRLWYAYILQVHLETTVRSIRRHAQNKHHTRRFKLTKEDAESGTDHFLELKGPPTLDFPFHRDNYYLLEAYMPNRSWSGDQERWMYMPAEQHNTDLGFVVKYARWKEQQDAKKALEGEAPQKANVSQQAA